MIPARRIAGAGRLFACILAGLSLPALAGGLPPLAHSVTGGYTEYTIQSGDFLIAIGARFGVAATLLALQNAIPYDAIIYPGQRLYIHNPHIVPAALDDGILINLPQRMLFHFSQGKLRVANPVGLGKPSWPTPQGEFRIVSRVKNKPWLVPKSIQEEMRREGKVVLQEVPPGPDNPLGEYWLGLNLWGYGIHSTIAPASIYQFCSHGCIRLHPDDIAELFEQVRVGTPGRLIYQPVLLAVVEDGRILLEVHRDIYNKGIDPAQIVRDMAEANGLYHAVDWIAVDAVIAAQDGLAREVGRLAPYDLKGNP
ncbi:MAG TPA: L,D-transpeptidase family protein [Thiobacillus sp.]|nr:L,D-transpeptidase family protein [Thiobacillus sp.]